MEGDHIKICNWLLPLSWLYGLGVMIRNTLFDCGILHSETFDVPIISVGNLTVGGTGKTPHSEYLIRLLSSKYQVAILSRGYKRKSKGFRLAESETPEEEIGDEPYQMKKKYPFIHMAVDKDRRRGIKKLIDYNIKPPVDVIILDDAYQHRYVKPGVNILLIDYHRLICYDKLLPAGRLREQQSNKRRADIVIVSKCPKGITPMERKGIERTLGLFPWQHLYFSYFRYGDLHPLYEKGESITLEEIKENGTKVMLLSGIASPKQLEYDLRAHIDFTSLHFSDHHDFKPSDISRIEEAFENLGGGEKIIITTEKDSARLLSIKLNEKIARAVYVLPIEVDFIGKGTEDFNNFIIGYVQKNSRNSTLLKRKNAVKA